MEPASRKNVALFLRPEPPLQQELSERLFVNRELELIDAQEQIRAFLLQPQRTILAVVGTSRVGKSHFLKELVRRVQQEFEASVDLRIVQKLPDAKVVLRAILAQLTADLGEAWQRLELAGPDPLQDFNQLRERMGPLIEGEADEIEVTEMRTLVKTIQGQLTLGLKAGVKATAKLPAWLTPILSAGVDASAEGSAQHQRQTGTSDGTSDSRKIKYKAYTERQLCDLIGLAHAIVRMAAQAQGRQWRTLIIVDDFDLLTISPDGSLNPFPLLDGLHQICQWQDLFVLSTVREDTYDHRTKSFQLVCNIPPFTEEKRLLEIYQRHVTELNADADPFLPTFIAEAARTCEGKPGVFLDLLYRAYRDTRLRRDLHKLDLATYLDNALEELRQLVGDDLFKAIEDAVPKSGGEVDSGTASKLRFSSAMRYLMEEYSTHDRLRISPIVLSHLRKKLA